MRRVKAFVWVTLCLGVWFSSCKSSDSKSEGLQRSDNASGAQGLQEQAKPDSRVTPVSGRISAGEFVTCAASDSGGIKCWGKKFGNNPKAVPGLVSGVKAVVASDDFSCAVMNTGDLKCWNCGDPKEEESAGKNGQASKLEIVELEIAAASLAMTKDRGHACAILTTGEVTCWGSNSYHQLGAEEQERPEASDIGPVADGSGLTGVLQLPPDESYFVEYSLNPVTVEGFPSAAKQVAVGSYHSCALLDSGDIYCWGDNRWGQRGNGNERQSDPTWIPSLVVGVEEKAAAIAAGKHTTCALLRTGGVKCWGGLAGGKLADKGWQDSFRALQVKGLERDVVSLAAGSGHFCAITSSGAVRCWGINNAGQLGDGSRQDSWVPVEVKGIGGKAVELALGRYHSCALLDSGEIKCWGDNLECQLGNGKPCGRDEETKRRMSRDEEEFRRREREQGRKAAEK